MDPLYTIGNLKQNYIKLTWCEVKHPLKYLFGMPSF